MSVTLLTEHHLEFLSLKGGCTGSSEFQLVKMPHCWKSYVTAHVCIFFLHVAYYVGDASCPFQSLTYGKRSVFLIIIEPQGHI